MTWADFGAAPLKPWNVHCLIAQIGARHGLTREEMMARTRATRIAHARWEVFEALSARGWSLPRIGRVWNMHHTTVLHGLRSLARLRAAEAARTSPIVIPAHTQGIAQ